MKTPYRIVMTTRDIEKVLGVSGRTARRIHLKIRKHFNLAKFVTISLFCEFTGMTKEEVHEVIFS